MKVGVPRESFPGERRVAATPDTVARLKKLGFDVLVEEGAGAGAGFSDAAFAAAGAGVVDAEDVLDVDVLLKVRAPSAAEIERCRAGLVVLSFVWPAQNPALLEALRARGVTALALDCVPRITRAQKMDALSSMANIAGYRAVVEAAHNYGRFFAGQITAAGKVAPAKILVIGAGVAGLAAIGAARGMGAVVRAFDTRPVVKEQVQSMGAEFLEVTLDEDGAGSGGYAKEMSPAFIAAEMELFRQQAKDVDVIITTALIPGKPAPKLLDDSVMACLKPGSVVVDLAAEQGGNCVWTVPGERVVKEGVVVLGYTDLTSRLAAQASQLYGTNLCHLLDELGGASKFSIDFENVVLRQATVVKDGAVTWPPPPLPAQAPPPAPSPAPSHRPADPTPAQYPAEAPALKPSAPKAAPSTTTALAPQAAAPARSASKSHGHGAGHTLSVPPAALFVSGLVLLGVGVLAPPAFLTHLIVFVLACFIGYQVIWSVAPALHTPLMSVTNAISGVILVGGLLHANDGLTTLPVPTVLGAIAILIATINVAGGFLVTQRMLKMFRRGDGS